MSHFFVEPGQISQGKVLLTGPDVNHIKNALRMKLGEEILVSDGRGGDFCCRIESMDQETVQAEIISQEKSRELPCELWLFQGLPKSDKMEWVIQKAVELGAAAIVPVSTRNTVVRLNGKREEGKLRRWQAIAESGAKQCRRGLIPKVFPVMGFQDVLSFVEREAFDLKLIPYENEREMEPLKEAMGQVKMADRIGILIGPEGGFDPGEIRLAGERGWIPVSLGRRILRTETAGLALLSLLMFRVEGGI